MNDLIENLKTVYTVEKDDPVNCYMFLYCPKHNTYAIKTYEEIASNPFIVIERR